MSKTRLFQLAGLAGVVSGALLILLDIAFIVIFGDQPERVAAATPSWLILIILSIVAAYLVLMALMGLFARQAEGFGRFGLTAFVIASFGTVKNIGYNWSGRFIVPELTSAAPDFLDQVGDSLPAIIASGFIATFALFALGWLLFAIASLKTKVLPALPLWLMIFGSILGLVFRMAGLGIPGVLFGAALAWLGWHMWRGVENKQAVPGILPMKESEREPSILDG